MATAMPLFFLKKQEVIMDKFDIIVVGAGPAGMTAALNCLRAGKSVLVLESDSFGGQIAYSPRVENFPSYQKISGSELMDKLYEQISEWGAQIELEKAQSIVKTPFGFELTTDYNNFSRKSLSASSCTSLIFIA